MPLCFEDPKFASTKTLFLKHDFPFQGVKALEYAEMIQEQLSPSQMLAMTVQRLAL